MQMPCCNRRGVNVFRWMVIALLALGCRASVSTTNSGEGHAFELVCDSTDTRETSTLFCMLHDTRTGDVRRVDISKLPQSNGPTKSEAGPPGSYQLVCDSTDTESSSDFRCIRLNRRNGEMMLVNLRKVSAVPE